MDYSGLVAAVLRRLGPEKGDAASGMKRFVRLAEDQVYRRLRHRAMEFTKDVTVDGVGESSLPDDFVALIGITQGGEEVPHQSSRLNEARPASGAYYFIEGRTLVTSGVDGTVKLQYYRKLTSILDSGYDMLTEEPELFINATVLQAMQDMGRTNEYAFELKKLMGQIDEVNDRNSTSTAPRRRVSGLAKYSGRIA